MPSAETGGLWGKLDKKTRERIEGAAGSARPERAGARRFDGDAKESAARNAGPELNRLPTPQNRRRK